MLVMRDLLEKVWRSCQVFCDRDIKVRVLMTVSSIGARGLSWKSQKDITPKSFWVEKLGTYH